jgi:hypothetical protein
MSHEAEATRASAGARESVRPIAAAAGPPRRWADDLARSRKRVASLLTRHEQPVIDVGSLTDPLAHSALAPAGALTRPADGLPADAPVPAGPRRARQRPVAAGDSVAPPAADGFDARRVGMPRPRHARAGEPAKPLAGAAPSSADPRRTTDDRAVPSPARAPLPGEGAKRSRAVSAAGGSERHAGSDRAPRSDPSPARRSPSFGEPSVGTGAVPWRRWTSSAETGRVGAAAMGDEACNMAPLAASAKPRPAIADAGDVQGAADGVKPRDPAATLADAALATLAGRASGAPSDGDGSSAAARASAAVVRAIERANGRPAARGARTVIAMSRGVRSATGDGRLATVQDAIERAWRASGDRGRAGARHTGGGLPAPVPDAQHAGGGFPATVADAPHAPQAGPDLVRRLARSDDSLEAVQSRQAEMTAGSPPAVQWLEDDDELAGRLQRVLGRQARARGIDLS